MSGGPTGELGPDELQLAFHEVECHCYDERFGIHYDHHLAAASARETRRLLGDARFDRVLDVGCGTGYLGLGLVAAGTAASAVLVDLSPGMLARTADNARALGVEVDLVRATAADLPFPDQAFDAVVSRGVLHHLHDPVAALREWRRVVAPGGPVLLLSEPTAQADRVGGSVARLTLAGLAAARRVGEAVGRPVPRHPPDEARTQRFWDLVAMAANIHTFSPDELEHLGREAGFTELAVSGSGAVATAWAAAWYVLVGEVPTVGRTERSRRRAARLYGALRRFDDLVSERVLPDRALLTVQARLSG